MVTRPAVVAVALAAAALLAGCMPSPERPQPATEEEIAALRQAEAIAWWDSFGTGTPMPDVAVIEELPPQEAYERQAQCIGEAALPGVTVGTAGEWSYDGDAGPNDEEYMLVMQQQWICSQQFPSADQDDYVLSQSELAWLHDFYVKRYVPCLASFGYEATYFPNREQFVGEAAGYPAWMPHDYSVSPAPTSHEWRMLASKCPLPNLLDPYDLPAMTSG